MTGQNSTWWAQSHDEGWKLRQDLQRHARGDVASPSQMEIDAQKSACLRRIGVTLEVAPSYVASGYRRWMGLCALSSSLDVFMKQVFIKRIYMVNTSGFRVSVSERTVTLYFRFKTKVTLETCFVSVDLEQIWNWNEIMPVQKSSQFSDLLTSQSWFWMKAQLVFVSWSTKDHYDVSSTESPYHRCKWPILQVACCPGLNTATVGSNYRDSVHVL